MSGASPWRSLAAPALPATQLVSLRSFCAEPRRPGTRARAQPHHAAAHVAAAAAAGAAAAEVAAPPPHTLQLLTGAQALGPPPGAPEVQPLEVLPAYDEWHRHPELLQGQVPALSRRHRLLPCGTPSTPPAEKLSRLAVQNSTVRCAALPWSQLSHDMLLPAGASPAPRPSTWRCSSAEEWTRASRCTCSRGRGTRSLPFTYRQGCGGELG